jgi:hypothetical protein
VKLCVGSSPTGNIGYGGRCGDCRAWAAIKSGCSKPRSVEKLACLLPIGAHMEHVESMMRMVVWGCIGATVLAILITGIALFVSFRLYKRRKFKPTSETVRATKLDSTRYVFQR